jgi:hypothetical protein
MGSSLLEVAAGAGSFPETWMRIEGANVVFAGFTAEHRTTP